MIQRERKRKACICGSLNTRHAFFVLGSAITRNSEEPGLHRPSHHCNRQEAHTADLILFGNYSVRYGNRFAKYFVANIFSRIHLGFKYTNWNNCFLLKSFHRVWISNSKTKRQKYVNNTWPEDCGFHGTSSGVVCSNMVIVGSTLRQKVTYLGYFRFGIQVLNQKINRRNTLLPVFSIFSQIIVWEHSYQILCKQWKHSQKLDD